MEDTELLIDELVERLRERLAPPPAYTVASLAEALGVSAKSVSNAVRRGELRAVKRGGRWLISAREVDAWVDTAASQPSESRPLLAAWARDNGQGHP